MGLEAEQMKLEAHPITFNDNVFVFLLKIEFHNLQLGFPLLICFKNIEIKDYSTIHTENVGHHGTYCTIKRRKKNFLNTSMKYHHSLLEY